MILFDETLLLICTGTSLLGIMAGAIGCTLFLQRKSLFGDTISHATFPGLTALFFFTLSKNPVWLLCGGMISALIAAYTIQSIQTHTTLKRDSILGIILTSAFGIGTLLLSKIQSMPDASQAGLTKYLLGSSTSMMWNDISIMFIAFCITTLIMLRYYKSYTIVIFDPTYAHIIGIAHSTISWIMLAATTVIIVVGLQCVGIILMSALLINPAAAAYQWAKSLRSMMLLASFFGACSTISGTMISYHYPHMPTGPVIVIISTLITLIAILISPQGLLRTWWNHKQAKQQFNHATLLSRFLLFNEGKDNPYHPHHIAALDAIGKTIAPQDLQLLQQQGFVETTQHNFWKLTPKGVHLLKQLGYL